MQAHDVAARQCAYLHQVAEMMREPQAASTGSVHGRTFPSGERRDEMPAVADFTDHRVVVSPGAQCAVTAAVAEAVGCNLVRGECEVARCGIAEPQAASTAAHESAYVREGRRVEVERLGGRRWIRQGRIERRAAGVQSAIFAARRKTVFVEDERMTTQGFVDHRGRQRGHVVRAEQSPR